MDTTRKYIEDYEVPINTDTCPTKVIDELHAITTKDTKGPVEYPPSSVLDRCRVSYSSRPQCGSLLLRYTNLIIIPPELVHRGTYDRHPHSNCKAAVCVKCTSPEEVGVVI